MPSRRRGCRAPPRRRLTVTCSVVACSHLVHHPNATWNDLPSFPKAAAAALDSKFAMHTTRLVHHRRSADGTVKMLVQLADGLQVEAVIMSYDTTGENAAVGVHSFCRWHSMGACNRAPRCLTRVDAAAGLYGEETGQQRATLCVSSEVGCQMGCTFCATGTMGLTADLTAGEIVEQLVHANAVAQVRNVVFMVSCRVGFSWPRRLLPL